MKDSRTLGIGESHAFENFEHLRCSFLDVGAEIKEASLNQQLEEDPAELDSKHSALLVRALPPGVWKVEMNRRQGTGREQSRDFDPRIRLHHFQVCRTSAARAPVQFASELLPPFQRDIANPRKPAHIVESKPPGPAADLQLQWPVPAKHLRPIGWRRKANQFLTNRVWQKRDAGHAFSASRLGYTEVR
jgi:hypothetical protein